MANNAASKSKSGSAPPNPINKAYLIVYNAASAAAWAVVLARTLSISRSDGPQYVFLGVGEWTRTTQTMAIMEILHSLFGMVRAPLFTTTMQVSSRLLLVWAIISRFPFLAMHPSYTSMLIAWSVTEVIRYTYFALHLMGIHLDGVTWMRYNAFFALYPLGILSECNLIFLATEPAGRINPIEKWALYSILAVYVPGSYILYTYMMTQRKKVMGGGQQQKAQ